tara:strand:- start:37 stop:705 length:669 start_codon:yes stop_codon:yes gene_type:complete
VATSTAELREIWLGRLCERGAAELDLRPGSGAVEPTKIEREVKKKTTRAPRTASPTSPRAPRRHRVTRRFTMRVLLALLGAASAFVGPAAPRQPTKLNVVDAALAAALASAPVDVAKLNSRLPTTTLAKTRTITREGLYGDYTVEIIDEPNPLDDARSTFKTRAQTKKGKNKYLGLFVVLLFGSFVIPMAQYFWYVRDTPDSLFANEEPPPPPPAPKKFWER